MAACFDSPRTTAPEPSPSHFQLHYESPDQDLEEAGRAAQSGQPFTAAIRISHSGAGLGEVALGFSEPEVIDIQVKFTGEDKTGKIVRVSDKNKIDWVPDPSFSD